MSHQTGIKSNNELLQMMAEAKYLGNDIRLLKVIINTELEELQLANSSEGEKNRYPIKGSWDCDFQQYVRKLVDPCEPCFIFFRMDFTNQEGYNEWAFIFYSPEQTPVRKKMLYASTKSTLKKEFGTGINYDYFADSIEALTVGAFQNWINSKNSKVKGDDDEDVNVNVVAIGGRGGGGGGSNEPFDLLTANEDERRKVKQLEFELSLEQNQKKTSKFEIPLRPEAINGLLDYRDNRIVYLRLKVNLANEEIYLASKKTSAEHSLFAQPLCINNVEHKKKRLLPPSNDADDYNLGFHLFHFTHINGAQETLDKSVFVFVMPTEKTTVKQRLVYSACLISLFDAIANRINVPIDKRIEVDSADDVTVGYVAEKLYPELENTKVEIEKNSQKFDKPRPAGRGPRRMIK